MVPVRVRQRDALAPTAKGADGSLPREVRSYGSAQVWRVSSLRMLHPAAAVLSLSLVIFFTSATSTLRGVFLYAYVYMYKYSQIDYAGCIETRVGGKMGAARTIERR